MTNIMRGVQTDAIIDTLKNHRFSDAQIKAALSDEPELAANESKQTIRKLPNNWKEWVASNLLAETTKAGIAKTLAQQGFSSAEIALEIQTASKSPYLRAAAKTAQTLKKREWLLATCDHFVRLDPGYNQQLDVIDTPAFEVFIKNHYSKHKPVVLQNSINHWPALKKWSPQYFAEVLGAAEIQVQFDRESDALFIPIGWWYCVEGLDKSISISFTNFNAPNSYAEGFKKAQG